MPYKDPEKQKEYMKKYSQKHKKKWKEYSQNRDQNKYRKKYYQEHPEALKKTKYNMYKNGAKERNLEFNITFEEFITFWQKPCYYCGNKIETIGLDRVDNEKGYTINNIVSCCRVCNHMKNNLSQKIFINYCRKIIEKSTLF